MDGVASDMDAERPTYTFLHRTTDTPEWKHEE